MKRQGAFLRKFCETTRNLLAILVVSILFVSIAIASVNGQVSYLIFLDDFNDYEEKIYTGSNGPGVWYQMIGGGGAAEYVIVKSGTVKFYDLKSLGGVFVKSILPYYIFGYYVGPNDYDVNLQMKIVDKEGGVIFRVTDLKKYYLATVYQNPKKLVLWYVNEDEGAGAGPKLGESPIPAGVDVTNWFSLRALVYKNNITIYVEGQKLLSVLDNRLPSGTIGLYTFQNGEAYFDNFWVAMITMEQTITTTKTITSPLTTTTTKTETEFITTYVTTTASGAATTLTLTNTETTTLTTTIPETVTVAEPTTITKMETTETVKTVPGPTETVTTTVSQGLGLKCLIATAAYGSEIAPQVQALREFRDDFVMKTFAGSSFMEVFNAFYYSWSPYIAEAEYKNDALRNIVKFAIYPLIYSLELSKEASRPLSTFPEIAVLVSGLIASSLIGLIYCAPATLTVYFILKQKGVKININLTYLLTLLGVSLVLYFIAEIFASSYLMMLASPMIILSTLILAMSAIVRIFSTMDRNISPSKKDRLARFS